MSKQKSIQRTSRKMPRLDRSRSNAVERDLVEGLEGFLEDLESGEPIEKKYTCRRVVLDLQPKAYTAKQVKSARQSLNASQALFAQFLGVSVKTVRAWELGKPPAGIACRFLDEIERNPRYWKRRLRESMGVRTAS